MTQIPPPGLFQVETTNYCNLDCAMCARTIGLTRPIGHMDIGLFREIVDQSARYQMPIHWFHHFGEPLLYPHFREASEYFRKKGFGRGAISTNALLLNDDKIDILLENCSYVLCCVDSANPEAYVKIRANNHHKKVVKNVANLIAERDKRNANTQIVVQFLRTIHNKDEDVRDLMELFGQHPMLKYIEKRTDKHPYGADLTVFANPNDQTGKRTCAKARTELCILWDGACLPCCWDADGQLSIGNIKDQPLNEIWQGHRHKEFQRTLLEGRFDELALCNRCSGPVIDGDYASIELINTWVDRWKRSQAKVVVAPGSQRMGKILQMSRLLESNILAFCDANPQLHGTSLEGIPVRPYEAIDTLQPNVLFIHSERHGTAIYDSLKHYIDKGVQIFQVAAPLD